MAGKKRSGLANDRRAYSYGSAPVVPPNYTVTYNGNNHTGGNTPISGSSSYISGSIVTVLGNVGSPILSKSGFTFTGWNTTENGSGTSYSTGNIFTINADITLYAQWNPIVVYSSVPAPAPVVTEPVVTAPVPGPSAPTSLSSVGGNQAAYILFTQSGNVTNYEYSTDDGSTFLLFDPPQIYSPVEINTLSSDVETRLTNGTEYTVKLRAVNSGVSSSDSVSVTVTPTTTNLLTTNRIIYLDANNTSSYSGSGTTWTNLDSGGSYSADLSGSPPFNVTDEYNKYFEFNTGSATGQFAQINQDISINPVVNTPFTIQMWVKINNIGSQGTLVSKMFDGSKDYDGYNFIYTNANELQLHLNGSGQDIRFKTIAGVLRSEWVLYTANIQFGSGGGRKNKLFVNGRQVLNVTSNEGYIRYNNQNLTFPAGFGGDGECDIGQFYYYNTELTTAQIIQNYDATKPRYI